MSGLIPLPENSAAQVARLKTDFGFVAIVASEIEFYLHGSDDCAALADFWNEVKAACAAQNIGIFKIEKEKGREQHEVALMPAAPEKSARDADILKTIIADAAARFNMRADFSARPFADQPGSGLHIHVHLENEKGERAYYKKDAVISDALKFSIGGLLAWLPDSMAIFAPHAASYQRFVAGSHAPLTVSWGANNRTVAIRLPDADPHMKRIEHRVAGSDADPEAVIAVILAAIHDGLRNKTEPGAQIYGDASLSHYGLPVFPLSLEKALELHRNSLKLAAHQDMQKTHI